MKTINTLLKTILLITVLVLVSCNSDSSDNDAEGYDPSGQEIANKFTVDNSKFETTKAYLIIWKDGTEFANKYSFVFTDGKIKEDLVAGSLLTTATNHFAMIDIITGGANVTSEQDIIDKASLIAIRINLSDDTVAVTSILNWNNVAMYDSEQYGKPNGMTSYLKYGVNIGNFTTNVFSADLTTRTGIINCEYFFKDSSGAEILGRYNGNFEIINENL